MFLNKIFTIKKNYNNCYLYFNIHKEDSVKALTNIYLDLNFDVVQAANGNSYADFNDMQVVILCPIAIFCVYKLTTSSWKHLKDKSRVHIVSLK